MNLLFNVTTTDDGTENVFDLYGLRRSIDPKTGKPDKEIYQPIAGDTIIPLYKSFNDKRERFEWIEGNTINITQTTTLKTKDLNADEYSIGFKFTDFSFNSYKSEIFKFER